MEQLPYSTVVTLVKNMNEKDLYIHIVLHWTADFMITDNNGSVTFHLVVDHLFNHYPHIGHRHCFPCFWFEKHQKYFHGYSISHSLDYPIQQIPKSRITTEMNIFMSFTFFSQGPLLVCHTISNI